MKIKKTKTELTTMKVTPQTIKNIKLAAALLDRTQYEIAEEGSSFMVGKAYSKSKKHKQ